MTVEQNSGMYLGIGIIAQVVGGGIWFSSLGGYGNEGTAIGGVISLIGLGLIITGITKVAKNIEINAIASVSAESHLHVMRDIAMREEYARLNPGQGPIPDVNVNDGGQTWPQGDN